MYFSTMLLLLIATVMHIREAFCICHVIIYFLITPV